MSSLAQELKAWIVPAIAVAALHVGFFALPLHFSRAESEEPRTIQLTLAAVEEPTPLEEPPPPPEEPPPPPPEEPPPPPPPVEPPPVEPPPPVEREVAVAEPPPELEEEPPPEIQEPPPELEEPPEPPREEIEPVEDPPPPQPAPPPAPPPVDWRGYGGGVVAAVQAEENYPRMARRRGHEGVARVRVAIHRDGTLAAPPLIVESSGHRSLDDEALRMVEAAAPFTAFPDHAAEDRREFVLPLQFRLR